VAVATEVTLYIPASLNKHFVVRRSVKSFYTSRERQIAKLEAVFKDTAYRGQKRFVIYGLGGSGKTELALKYAEDYM
jgi:Cdc6-like AAA superfamily ATPase